MPTSVATYPSRSNVNPLFISSLRPCSLFPFSFCTILPPSSLFCHFPLVPHLFLVTSSHFLLLYQVQFVFSFFFRPLFSGFGSVVPSAPLSIFLKQSYINFSCYISFPRCSSISFSSVIFLLSLLFLALFFSPPLFPLSSLSPFPQLLQLLLLHLPTSSQLFSIFSFSYSFIFSSIHEMQLSFPYYFIYLYFSIYRTIFLLSFIISFSFLLLYAPFLSLIPYSCSSQYFSFFFRLSSIFYPVLSLLSF